jgi:hypothetical protein
MADEGKQETFRSDTLPTLLRGLSSGKGTQYRSASGDVALWKSKRKIGGTTWMENQVSTAVSDGHVNGKSVQSMLTRRANQRKKK